LQFSRFRWHWCNCSSLFTHSRGMTGCSGVPQSVRARHIRYSESQPLQRSPGHCLWMQVFLSWSQDLRSTGVHATGVSRCEPCGIFKPPSEVPAGAALPNQAKAASAKAKHVSERKKMRLFNPAYSSSLSPASRTMRTAPTCGCLVEWKDGGFANNSNLITRARASVGQLCAYSRLGATAAPARLPLPRLSRAPLCTALHSYSASVHTRKLKLVIPCWILRGWIRGVPEYTSSITLPLSISAFVDTRIILRQSDSVDGDKHERHTQKYQYGSHHVLLQARSNRPTARSIPLAETPACAPFPFGTTNRPPFLR